MLFNLIKLIQLVLVINYSQCINIEEFGAKPFDSSYDTSILNGKALNAALYAANKSKDDRTVLVESQKTYTLLPAGLVTNLVNVTILLEGRLNAWDGEYEKWPKDESGHAYSFILIRYTENLTIKGNGIVDGFGFAWWLNVILTGNDNRPNLIDLSVGKNTLIDGITVFNSPQYHLFLMDQLDLIVRNVIVHVDITPEDSFKFPIFPLNTDGIDVSGKNIHLNNVSIVNFDDAVAIKPLKLFESNFTNCTQDILVENSYVKLGVGMSIGSITPNQNNECIKNVTFRNITFQDPLKAIYIKANPGDEGTAIISNILYENLEIHNALWWAIFIGPQQQQQPHKQGKSCSFFFPLNGTECIANPRVTIQDITLRNINIYNGILSPGILICNQTNPCTNFLFDNVNAYKQSAYPVSDGYICENVSGFAKNSNVYPKCLTNI